MHQVDDIIVIQNGTISEHGSFDELMRNKGALAQLVANHVQIVEKPNDEACQKEAAEPVRNQEQEPVSAAQIQVQVSSQVVSSTPEVGAAEEESEVIPQDAEPMKLVLEDQSVNYKKSPVLVYLRAGNGLIATVLIMLSFFLVHGVRIGSGMFLFDAWVWLNS